MKIIKCKSKEIASFKAANEMINYLNQKPKTVLGLATGSTPLMVYKYLIEANRQNLISFKEVLTFNLDEYVGLGVDHPQSYHVFMHENLFNHIDIPKDQIHIPLSLEGNKQDALDYHELLSKVVIDIQILGIGVNGHIGFNEPGTSFSSITHIVNLSEETKLSNKRFFSQEEGVPKSAITMGISEILQARKIFLLAFGQTKKAVIKRLLEGKIDNNLPASVLYLHPDVTLFLDEEALPEGY